MNRTARPMAAIAAIASLCLGLALVTSIAAPTMAAPAPDGETLIAGSASKWFPGTMIMANGPSCLVPGSSTNQVMVTAFSSYGGAPNGEVVKVGQGYWASLTVSIAGFPCGSGVAAVGTQLRLPPGTEIDTARAPRCFGRPSSGNWGELTGGTWQAAGTSGPYCPASVVKGIDGNIATGVVALSPGQMYQIFVPVVSSQQLKGIFTQTDKFAWSIESTATYTNPALSTVWANVFPAGSGAGSGPFVYFANEPAAIPFWRANAPTSPHDMRNQVELFANIYTSGQAGTVKFEIVRTDTSQLVWGPGIGNYNDTFNGNVRAGESVVQVQTTNPDLMGPNKGFSPLAFDPASEWGVPMKVTWTFTPTSGPPVSASQTFTTLSGPDSDGDGVPDNKDACPGVKGTTANGCLPGEVPDPDGDGVYGALDKCPTVAAPGTLDGCPVQSTPVVPSTPGGATPTAPPSGATPPTTGGATPPANSVPSGPTSGGAQANVATAVYTLALKAGTTLTAKALAKGVPVPVTCSTTGPLRATVIVSSAVAKAKLKVKAPSTGLVLAEGNSTCRPGAGHTVTVRLTQPAAKALKKLRKPVPATVQLVGTNAQQVPVRVAR